MEAAQRVQLASQMRQEGRQVRDRFDRVIQLAEKEGAFVPGRRLMAGYHLGNWFWTGTLLVFPREKFGDKIDRLASTSGLHSLIVPKELRNEGGFYWEIDHPHFTAEGESCVRYVVKDSSKVRVIEKKDVVFGKKGPNEFEWTDKTLNVYMSERVGGFAPVFLKFPSAIHVGLSNPFFDVGEYLSRQNESLLVPNKFLKQVPLLEGPLGAVSARPEIWPPEALVPC